MEAGARVAVVSRSEANSSKVAAALEAIRPGSAKAYAVDVADFDAVQKVGDQIVTSRLSNEFPEGLLVGKVVEVYPAGGISDARASVRPAVDVSRVEEILVVK